ncbi:copper chaperone PCu(A)C [Pseudidiomarina sp.]|uniref:copper chaperone PCu(A)C n=1 Tax=Pseudidiomarina sp. TaxID=2081707 RepID=UPI00299F2BB7|nr:copper chaperone PCu(A)C [Pseudidiomarina sp.]MDX1706432.1 copper chaperone PCu(A)C [Pseudidiomarina sp.]
MRNGVISLFLTLLLISSVQAADIEVSNAWVKETIPGTENGAGYFTLTNQSNKPAILIGAKTDAARAVEVHQHVLTEGMMRMRRVPELTIAGGQTIVFQPGGYHLMIFGVKSPFVIGGQVEFSLHFADGDQVSIQADVRAIH